VANDIVMGVKRDDQSMKLQCDSFDFYVVALVGVNVVTGAQWLKTLGEFCMNLHELYQKFN
jgi:hypothetical protein